MDWAEMLERMYTRWAADHGYGVQVSDRNPGEEAGIKGVELSISGRWAYGYLKGAGAGGGDIRDEQCGALCWVPCCSNPLLLLQAAQPAGSTVQCAYQWLHLTFSLLQ